MADRLNVLDLNLRTENVQLGSGAASTGTRAVALGYDAEARIDKTVVISGAPVIRKDNGETDCVLYFSGAEVVILTKEVDLKTVADQTINLPGGSRFFCDEFGLIVTAATAVSGQPTVRAGWSGTPAGLLAATATSGLAAAGDRQRFTSLLIAAGKTSLVGGVTVAATATELKGRFYFRGVLVENE